MPAISLAPVLIALALWLVGGQGAGRVAPLTASDAITIRKAGGDQ